MRKKQPEIDLYEDLEKIKDALAEASLDVKGKAGQILNDSIEGVKERSAEIQDNVAAYTSEKPFKSLGTAMLAGLFLGYMFNLGKRRK